MVTFTKWGSCVSRDIFNFLDIEEYVPQHVYTGLSISTMLEPGKIQISEEDIWATSNFGKRMQMLCFFHESFSKFLSENLSEYFLFDLADERLPLQRYQCGKDEAIVPVTWPTYQTSKKILNSEKYCNLKISDWHLPDRDREAYKKKITEFCDEVLKWYDEEHIIYISLRQAQEFIESGFNGVVKRFEDYKGRAGIEKKELRNHQDMIIEYAESVIYEKMPGIWKISMPQNSLGDERHHFGAHPLHFHHYVYEYFAECIPIIAKQREEDLIEKKKSEIRRNIEFRKKYAEIKIEELKRIYKST